MHNCNLHKRLSSYHLGRIRTYVVHNAMKVRFGGDFRVSFCKRSRNQSNESNHQSLPERWRMAPGARLARLHGKPIGTKSSSETQVLLTLFFPAARHPLSLAAVRGL